MDTTETTRAVIHQWWDCLKRGDTEALHALCADDYHSWAPGANRANKEETVARAAWFRTLLVDGWFEFEDPVITVEDNRGCVATASYARLTNGNVYNNSYHFLLFVRDGKIVEAREYHDSLHWWNVLGRELAEHDEELAAKTAPS